MGTSFTTFCIIIQVNFIYQSYRYLYSKGFFSFFFFLIMSKQLYINNSIPVLTLPVNCDKIMQSCWYFDMSNSWTWRVSALDKHQNWNQRALFFHNSLSIKKFLVTTDKKWKKKHINNKICVANESMLCKSMRCSELQGVQLYKNNTALSGVLSHQISYSISMMYANCMNTNYQVHIINKSTYATPLARWK